MVSPVNNANIPSLSTKGERTESASTEATDPRQGRASEKAAVVSDERLSLRNRLPLVERDIARPAGAPIPDAESAARRLDRLRTLLSGADALRAHGAVLSERVAKILTDPPG